MAAETRAKKAAKSPQASKRKATEDVSPVTSKKQRAVLPPPKAAKPEPAAADKKAAKKAKPAGEKKPKPAEEKKPKKAKKAEPAPEPEAGGEEEEEEEDAAGSAVEEADDQTQALAKVIDEDADAEDAPRGEGFKQGQDVGKIPQVKKDKAAAKKAAAAEGGTVAATEGKEEPGVVYVGGLPHGFFEHQLKEYFSQFGPVSRLRLSRNKRTGASRHYAFLEFEELGTAEVVQRTMDGYLLFGNILRCRLVAREQVHEDLFKGAGRRFKKVPWNRMAGRELQKPRTEAGWALRVAREEKRRADRAARLQGLGYEFEGPKLKGPGEALKALAGGEQAAEEAPKAVEAAPAAEDKEEAEAEAAAEAPEEAAEKKAKAKGGKAKKAAKPKKVKS